MQMEASPGPSSRNSNQNRTWIKFELAMKMFKHSI